MLKLSNISKDYIVSKGSVHALKDISISFRTNEFVSILGPSGCGKTTLLNIIGGLDKNTNGKLIIDGVETDTFTQSDWDYYRNQKIGFIFQGYNLISTISVLHNVELSLAISGITKEERLARAKKVLEDVGLSEEINKFPNQLSGGQQQRVAIARALVNNPEIILADEPTGALDSETSVQIMDLIKKIASQRLVIMVTHNKDLAVEYSSRIIELKDGNIIGDSNPYDAEEGIKPYIKAKKTRMPFKTMLSLAFRNIKNKLRRNVLVSVASSIGILGVVLVIGLTIGASNFSNHKQMDMLSTRPIAVKQQSFDFAALLDAVDVKTRREFVKDANNVDVDYALKRLLDNSTGIDSFFISNDMNDNLLNYLNNVDKTKVSNAVTDYGIDFSNSIYTEYTNYDNVKRTMSISSIQKSYNRILNTYPKIESFSQTFSEMGKSVRLLPDSSDYVLSQYNIVKGSMPSSKNDLVLVINNSNDISDLVLASLGFLSMDDYARIVDESYTAMLENRPINANTLKSKISIDDIFNKRFVWYPNNSIYSYNSKRSNTTKAFLGIDYEYPCFDYNYDETMVTNSKKGVELKISCILEPKSNVNYGALKDGIYYTTMLQDYSLLENYDSLIGNKVSAYIENAKNNPDNPLKTDLYVSGNINDLDMGVSYMYQANYPINGEVVSAVDVYSLGIVDDLSMIISVLSPQSSALSYLTLESLSASKKPERITFYVSTVSEKNYITNYLDSYKDGRINYSDEIGFVFNTINTIINSFSIVLVCFTAISLIVSSIMIGVVIYVSVIERTKEIGIIRSIGGSKRDVLLLFVCEAIIIGLTAGLSAVIVGYIISFIANPIVDSYVGASRIINIPYYLGISLVLLGGVLSLIASIIPSISASRKNPVNALRSE